MKCTLVTLVFLLAGCQSLIKGGAAAAGGAGGAVIGGPGGAAGGAAIAYVGAEMYFQEQELNEREEMLINLAVGKAQGATDGALDSLFWWGKLAIAAFIAWYGIEKLLASKRGKQLETRIREEILERLDT